MKRLSVLFAGLVVLGFVSCGGNHSFDEAAVEEFAVNGAKPRLAMSKMAVANEAVAFDSVAASGDLPVSEGFERKLIYNGDISLEVTDLSNLQAGIDSWCKGLGGYISNSNCGQKNASFTVRIPASKFDEAMEEAGSFGTVKNKGVSTNDVSDEYYDLQSRLETRKLLREKLQSYLRQASNMQDMIKIERELNSVQSEIESMEGRMKRLDSQIDYATISIYATLPFSSTPGGGFELPDLGEGFRHFVAGLVSFFGGFIVVLLYAVICGIPVLAVAALLYWLLFGKIGLLLKLFERLKK